MLNFAKLATDDHVIAIGHRFGELRNSLCITKKDSVSPSSKNLQINLFY